MKGIKDFFHDSNDILLAILITLIAIGVVGWRLMVILDYPQQAAQDAANSAKATQTEQTQE